MAWQILRRLCRIWSDEFDLSKASRNAPEKAKTPHVLILHRQMPTPLKFGLLACLSLQFRKINLISRTVILSRPHVAAIADTAWRRLISLVPHEEPGTVEYEFWVRSMFSKSRCRKSAEELRAWAGRGRRLPVMGSSRRSTIVLRHAGRFSIKG